MRSDPQVRVEAAVWLARLRSELRSPADEAGFQTWLSETPQHRDAFEAVTAVFDDAGAVGRDFVGREVPDRSRMTRRAVVAGAATMAVAASTIGVMRWQSASGVIASEVGRPRSFALADGSRIVLDTKSSIQVSLSDERRLIRLLAGRARFEVAKDAARPFIVESGGRQVIAVGTAFSVASEGERMSVVLEEGRVVVRSPARKTPDDADDVSMLPGDRLMFAGSTGKAVEDRPDLAKLNVWQTGRLAFEDETLFAAVAEINRYSRRTIEVEDARSAGLRISGVYRADDPAGFARSIGLLLPVEVEDRGDRILIRAHNS